MKVSLTKLTGDLTHLSVVLTAVAGFLAVRVAVTHRLPPTVLHTLVVSAGAAGGGLPVRTAGLSSPVTHSGQTHQKAVESQSVPPPLTAVSHV